MLKRKSVLGALVIMSVLLVFSSQALAAWGRKDRPDRQELGAAIAKKLNLTQDQAAKFKAEEQNRQKMIEADRQKIKELGDKLKEELAKDSPDRNTVHNLITQIGAQMTEMRIARTDSLLKLRATLTPEQKEKFKELLNKKGGRMPLGLGGNRH